MPTSATGASSRARVRTRASTLLASAPLAPTSLASPSLERRVRTRGFTLLEVLVVLAIIAVLAGIAALSVGGVGSRRVENAAQRAEALVALACERAALTGRDMGIAVLADGLRFGYLAAQGWQPVGDDPADPLRPRALGDSIRLQLERDGERMEAAIDPPAAPQLACFGSGELTPFRLTIEGEGEPVRWHLDGALNGTLTLADADDA